MGVLGCLFSSLFDISNPLFLDTHQFTDLFFLSWDIHHLSIA
ncbi:hypothetical protein WL1483_1082 [Aeromonas schubertii]|uniref:Uncharacterized protein n=1 Tax=Aeromonas schubertii TaxID=652 RepID=A0A0S2SFL7_9GAMM|nr:hypothetical protein WL1483_1082 [Aeromonas schubertii]